MYKQLILQLLGRVPFIPERWPEDPWERMFQMADCATKVRLGELTITHFDVMFSTYTQEIDELFYLLETLIEWVGRQDELPPTWEARRHTKYVRPMAEYLSSIKHGYRAPQSVLELLVQKVAILHYQLEQQGLDEKHLNHSYLVREFSFIVHDTNELLEAMIGLRIN